MTPIAARVIRFDFHPTADGWRISEANSDVPGGYSESSHFPRLVAEHYPGTRPTGDPAGDLAGAVSARAGSTGRAVLVAAPGYLEDFQVIACLADALRHRGWQTRFAHPGQVEWEKGRARVRSPGGSFSPDLVVRFLQGEWLVRLPARRNWGCLVRGGLTPVCNPGTALVTESKRFPVVWDALGVPLPTWRALLPETRDPRDVDWRHDDRWLLKGAFSNNGDEVIDRRWSKPRDWRAADWSVWLRPRAWAAQRRFETLPLGTPVGPLYPCLGVYVIDGRFAGIYGRLAPRPLIDFAAVDVAVLVRDEVSHAT